MCMLLPIANVKATNTYVETPMTLNDCLIYARDHAHSNRIKRLDVEAAAAEKRITAADLMPYLSLGSSASLSFGRNIDPETNTYDNKRTLGSGFGLEMSLPLFDGLVRINNLKASKAALSRKDKEQKMEEDRISLEVIKGFYNISYCKAMVVMMESQLHRDSIDLEASKRSLALGIKSGADVAELEAIVAADKYELINQRNLLKKANLALRTSMGMPPSDAPISIDDELSVFQCDAPARTLPDIEEAEMAVKESTMYLRAAKGGYYPRLSFNAGISTSYYRMMGMQTEVPSFSNQFRDNMGEYFGFSLSIPIFDGFATGNRVKKASIQLLESKTRLEQTRYKIMQALDEARLDYDAAIEELNAATHRQESEEIANEVMRRKFELGAVSAIELYTSSSKLAEAKASLVGKRIQRVIAEITLRYYEGYPLINDEL